MTIKPGCFHLLIITLLAFGGVGCDSDESQADSDVSITFEPGQLVSSEVCGACHKDIYTFWKESVHATASTGEEFLEALEEAESLSGSDIRKTCLSCHAPASVVCDCDDLGDELLAEGVGCDFCHSLSGTDLSSDSHPFILDVSSVKLGPVPDAASTGHDIAYSEFHLSSLHCAGCHEYSNSNGVRLLSTYSEWEAYKEDGGRKTCQECHMPLVLAKVVDPKVKRVENSFVNLHSMPGGHSKMQLAKSLRLRIMELDQEGNSLKVRVKIANIGAGHMVPTGSPSRSVLLTVAVSTADGKLAEDEKIYKREVVDKEGKSIPTDSQLFLYGTSIASDTRFAPGEERIEDFEFSVVENENLEVTASLTYLYSPHNRLGTETRIPFFSETRSLTSSWSR